MERRRRGEERRGEERRGEERRGEERRGEERRGEERRGEERRGRRRRRRRRRGGYLHLQGNPLSTDPSLLKKTLLTLREKVTDACALLMRVPSSRLIRQIDMWHSLFLYLSSILAP